MCFFASDSQFDFTKEAKVFFSKILTLERKSFNFPICFYIIVIFSFSLYLLGLCFGEVDILHNRFVFVLSPTYMALSAQQKHFVGDHLYLIYIKFDQNPTNNCIVCVVYMYGLIIHPIKQNKNFVKERILRNLLWPRPG